MCLNVRHVLCCTFLLCPMGPLASTCCSCEPNKSVSMPMLTLRLLLQLHIMIAKHSCTDCNETDALQRMARTGIKAATLCATLQGTCNCRLMSWQSQHSMLLCRAGVPFSCTHLQKCTLWHELVVAHLHQLPLQICEGVLLSPILSRLV